MSTKVGEAYVELTLERKRWMQALTSARGDVERFVKSATGAFTRLGGVLGAAGLGFGLVKSIKEFAQENVKLVKLAATFDEMGLMGKTAAARIAELGAELQNVAGIADDVVLELGQMGAGIGRLSGVTLERAIRAAVGLSDRLDIDVKTSMFLIAKAAQGSTEALSRYGLVFDETATNAEKFAKLLEMGNSAMSISEKRVDTLVGRWQQLKMAVGDFGETIGAILTGEDDLKSQIESVTAAVKELTNFLGSEAPRGWADWFAAAKAAIEDAKLLVKDATHQTATKGLTNLEMFKNQMKGAGLWLLGLSAKQRVPFLLGTEDTGSAKELMAEGARMFLTSEGSERLGIGTNIRDLKDQLDQSRPLQDPEDLSLPQVLQGISSRRKADDAKEKFTRGWQSILNAVKGSWDDLTRSIRANRIETEKAEQQATRAKVRMGVSFSGGLGGALGVSGQTQAAIFAQSMAGLQGPGTTAKTGPSTRDHGAELLAEIRNIGRMFGEVFKHVKFNTGLK